MGVVQHDCVIAVGMLDGAKAWVKALPPDQQRVFHVDTTVSESYDIIIMVPDGSKEGWPTSDTYDKIREKFIRELRRCKWVHVSFGELGFEVKSNV